MRVQVVREIRNRNGLVLSRSELLLVGESRRKVNKLAVAKLLRRAFPELTVMMVPAYEQPHRWRAAIEQIDVSNWRYTQGNRMKFTGVLEGELCIGLRWLR